MGPAAPAFFFFFFPLNNGEKSRKKGNIPKIKALFLPDRAARQTPLEDGSGLEGGRTRSGDASGARGLFPSIPELAGFANTAGKPAFVSQQHRSEQQEEEPAAAACWKSPLSTTRGTSGAEPVPAVVHV